MRKKPEKRAYAKTPEGFGARGYRMLNLLVTPIPQGYEVNGSFCSMEPCGCLWTLPVPPESVTS